MQNNTQLKIFFSLWNVGVIECYKANYTSEVTFVEAFSVKKHSCFALAYFLNSIFEYCFVLFLSPLAIEHEWRQIDHNDDHCWLIDNQMQWQKEMIVQLINSHNTTPNNIQPQQPIIIQQKMTTRQTTTAMSNNNTKTNNKWP